MIMKEEIKICNNCQHASYIRGYTNTRECNHEKAYICQNLVSGDKIYETCLYMRNNRICGSDAILYEEP